MRNLLVNATSRRDTDGSIVGVFSVAQDVTEQRRNELKNDLIARELRQFVDTANAPIFGIDIHGNVNEWNNKNAEITGFSKEEAVGRPMVTTFISPRLREAAQKVMNDALHGKETANYELEFTTKVRRIHKGPDCISII